MCLLILLATLRTPPTSPPFPYTTLFRSVYRQRRHGLGHRHGQAAHQAPRAFHGRRERGLRRAARGGGFRARARAPQAPARSEEHTSELQSLRQLVCRLLLEKKKRTTFSR